MGKKIETKYILKGEDKTKGAMRSVQKNFKNTDKAAKGITSSLKSMMGPLLAIVGVGALINMGKNALEAADNLAKMSTALNVSVEALSALEYGAGLAGLTIANLEVAFRTMNKVISEAADGFGLAKKELKKLGVDIKALNKLTADKKLKVLADALLKVENAGDKAAIAGKLFGERVGSKFIKLLENGSAGIKEFTEEAERMGIVLSETEAKNAEDAIDAIHRLTSSFEGFKRSLLLSDEVKSGVLWIKARFDDMADALEQRKIDKEITKIMQAMIATGEAKENFGRGFPEGVDYKGLREYATLVYENTNAVTAWGEALNDIKGPEDYFQFGRGEAESVESTLTSIKKIAETITMEELTKNVAKINKYLTRVGKPLIEMEEYQFKLVDGTIQWVKANRENLAILNEYIAEYKKYLELPPPGAPGKPQRLVPPTPTSTEGDGPFGALKNNMIWIQEHMPMLLGVYDQYLDTLQEIQIQEGTLTALNWSLADSFAAGIGGSIDVVADSFGLLIDNMLSSEKQFIMFGRALRKMFAGIIADLISLILKAVVANLLLSALGLTGAGLTGIKAMFQSSIAAMGGIDLEKRAAGGSINAGQTYLVGERGPELFQANANGYVTPNNKLGGSVTNNNNIVINAEGNLLNDPLSLRRVTEAINDELTKVQNTYYEPQTV